MKILFRLAILSGLVACASSASANAWIDGKVLKHTFPWLGHDFYMVQIKGTDFRNTGDDNYFVVRAQFGTERPTATTGFNLCKIPIDNPQTVDGQEGYYTAELHYSEYPELKQNPSGVLTYMTFFMSNDQIDPKSPGGSLVGVPYDARQSPFTYSTKDSFEKINIYYSPDAWNADSGSRRVVVSFAEFGEDGKTTGPYVKLHSATEEGYFLLKNQMAFPQKAGRYRLRMNTLNKEYTADFIIESSCFN